MREYESIQEEIDRILTDMQESSTSASPAFPIGEQTGGDQPPPAETVRLIDIHIYDLPAEERESVEGSVAHKASQEEVTADKEPPAPATTPPFSSGALRRRYPPPWPFLVLAGSLLLAGLLTGGMVLVPLWTGQASITIVPVSHAITTQASLLVLTNGQAPTGSTPQQIRGRWLPSVTMSQQTSTPTTGHGHQDAQAAHGTITFYNAAPSPQSVAAGTLLTGRDGISVVTEQDAFLPVAVYPTFGQASVAAHAVLVGPAGNIAPADIYGPCCRLNLSAVSSAFRGGQLARDYPTVAVQDIQGTAASLSSSLQQSAQAAFQALVQPGETLITALSCQHSTSADHQPGEGAWQVQVTVSLSCRGAVYASQDAARLFAQGASQQARHILGATYTQVGDIQSRVMQTSILPSGNIALRVRLVSLWVAPFSPTQQAHLKALMVGKPRAEAITALLHTPGVQSVSLALTPDGAALPTDPGRIHLIFLIAG